MIKTLKNKIYTGITTDIERRFDEHLYQNGGAKFFRSDTPLDVVYYEVFLNRSEASKREYEIKKMKRDQKDLLILRTKI